MNIQPLKTLIKSASLELKALQSGDKKLLKTGFECIDTHIGGLLPGDIVLLCGLSSHGKSEMLFRMKENILNRDINEESKDYVYLDISLEMKMFNIFLRGVHRRIKKSKKKILFEEFTEEEKEIANTYYNSLKDDRIFMVQEKVTPKSFREGVIKFAEDNRDKKGIIISLDHILLIAGNDKKAVLDEVVECMNELKLIYGNLYFIILSQMNRDLLKRVDEKSNKTTPNSGDLFGSDFMQQAASYSIIIFNAFKVGINQYMKVDPAFYDYLSEHFGEEDKKKNKVSFETLGKLFYHVVKVREGDSVFKDIFIEDMEMDSETREKLLNSRKEVVDTSVPTFEVKTPEPIFDMSYANKTLNELQGSGFDIFE
jgi:archaellum biogenesis ATPase FlaH